MKIEAERRANVNIQQKALIEEQVNAVYYNYNYYYFSSFVALRFIVAPYDMIELDHFCCY